MNVFNDLVGHRRVSWPTAPPSGSDKNINKRMTKSLWCYRHKTSPLVFPQTLTWVCGRGCEGQASKLSGIHMGSVVVISLRELRCVSSVTYPARLYRRRRLPQWHTLRQHLCGGATSQCAPPRREGQHLCYCFQRVPAGMEPGEGSWSARNHAYCPRWQRETFHCLFSTPMRMFSGERSRT